MASSFTASLCSTQRPICAPQVTLPPPEPQFRQELERELEFSLPFGTKAPSRAPSKPSDARCARERAQRKAPTPVATYDAEAIAPAFAKAASAYGLSHDDVVIALRIAHDHDNGSIRRRNGGAPDDPRSGLHARLVLWLRKHGEQLQAVRRLSSRQPALPLVPKPSDDRAPTRAEQAAARARNASGARQVHPVDAGDDPRSMEEFRRLYAQQAAVRAALEAQRLAEHKAARQRIQ